MKYNAVFYAVAIALAFASAAVANQIDEISIVRGTFQSADASLSEYEIEISIVGQDIKSASFSCEGFGAGILDYEFDEDQWCFEDSDSNIDFFTTYPNGNFEIIVVFNNDEVRNYAVNFANISPEQMPAITYPAHMQTGVETEPTFTWDAITDPQINAIHAWIDDLFVSEEIWETITPFFDTTMVSLDSPLTLPSNRPMAFGLVFANYTEFDVYDPATDDEISVITSAYNSVEITFATTAVPEPSTILMIAAGALGLAGAMRKHTA